jgi:hypothetical protein
MARAAPSPRRPVRCSPLRPRGARRAPSARGFDGEHRPSRAPGARRTPLSLRKRRRRIHQGWHRDRTAHLARKCPQWRSRRSLCARAGAPCSRSISESGDARNLAPTSAHCRPRAFARLGRRSPRRSFPPGPPNLGTPIFEESPGGKDALARRRSEWPGTATAGSPRGERRATTAPRSRPFPHQPLPPPRGPTACRATGPAGAGQASRLGRRRAVRSPRPLPSGARDQPTLPPHPRAARAPVAADRWRRRRSRLHSPPRRRSWPATPARAARVPALAARPPFGS